MTARYMNLIKNDYSRLLLLLVQPVAIALLLFLVAQEGTFVNFDDTKSILFALSCSGIWIGLFNTIQEVCKERAILKREYMGNLRLSGYVLSKYIVQGIICLIQATLLTTIFLNLLEHTAKGGTIWGSHPGMEIWLTMVLTIFASASMGLIVSSLVRNADRAMAFAPFVLIVQLLFSGVLFALGDGALVISKITVSRWSMECLGNTADLNALPYKEKDFTSHDVVAKLRGILRQKKIGHTGTLDPNAEGVLPVCLGKGTKLCDMLTGTKKQYKVSFVFEKETDTEDIWGTVTKTHEPLKQDKTPAQTAKILSDEDKDMICAKIKKNTTSRAM